MGLTGGLVRSVFSRNRSVGSYDSKVRSHGVDKKRWRSSVRSYLCGEEFNSVLAEEDSASIKSSEATVTQPVMDELDYEIVESGETELMTNEYQNSHIVPFIEENAATVIQSAFRRFLARRRDGGVEEKGEMENTEGQESPGRSSIGTSIEVQTAGSLERLTIDERVAQQRLHMKVRTQMPKLKEDWDDSTVSSNVSKLRIQNRLEASTRRERALAYAFSQQLRICSKKKQKELGMSESNMSWTWLERWMATRQSETLSAEDPITKQLEQISNDGRFVLAKKKFDVAAEEKESCGSNEIPPGVDYLVINHLVEDDDYKPVKNRLRGRRTVSRRKTVPSNLYPTQSTKVGPLREPERFHKGS
ncbi:hypothetical protein Syun_026871 [Stephania yunnanensis]|uniref:Protein IQ-DOMAIN 1 n=1 Tax=Stephania yunnanensis TaxID=152371 RepID=A0AAP0EEL2_9MAGN